MDRVSIVGCSGSGKTTLGRQLAAAMGCPYVELDSLFHLPNWTELPDEQFRSAINEVVTQSSWVIDGNYSVVQEIVWNRADTVIWFDLSFLRVMWQVVARTIRRMILRTELWNGNRERLVNLFSFNPQRSIIAWTATNHRRYREQYLSAESDPHWVHASWVRLRSPAEVRALMINVASGQKSPGGG